MLILLMACQSSMPLPHHTEKEVEGLVAESLVLNTDMHISLEDVQSGSFQHVAWKDYPYLQTEMEDTLSTLIQDGDIDEASIQAGQSVADIYVIQHGNEIKSGVWVYGETGEVLRRPPMEPGDIQTIVTVDADTLNQDWGKVTSLSITDEWGSLEQADTGAADQMATDFHPTQAPDVQGADGDENSDDIDTALPDVDIGVFKQIKGIWDENTQSFAFKIVVDAGISGTGTQWVPQHVDMSTAAIFSHQRGGHIATIGQLNLQQGFERLNDHVMDLSELNGQDVTHRYDGHTLETIGCLHVSQNARSGEWEEHFGTYNHQRLPENFRLQAQSCNGDTQNVLTTQWTAMGQEGWGEADGETAQLSRWFLVLNDVPIGRLEVELQPNGRAKVTWARFHDYTQVSIDVAADDHLDFIAPTRPTKPELPENLGNISVLANSGLQQARFDDKNIQTFP